MSGTKPKKNKNKILKKVDSDKSGHISYEGFLETIKKDAWREKLIKLSLVNLQPAEIRLVFRT